MSNLDSFVKYSRQPATTVTTSQEIRDRGSAFVGNVYRATTPDEAKAAVHHHKHVVHAAKEVYEISAWRCMVLKAGRTGLGGPDDFELKTGYNDDGEQWAGSKVLKVMQAEGVIDAVVIVSRWFGGTLLGPVRFTHIETCASEVCRKFKKVEEMQECVQTLKTLDSLLATLRVELETHTVEQRAASSQSAPARESRTKSKPPDYTIMEQGLDLTKAKRLIHARESAINSVKTLIAKRKATA
ncbi:ribosomal protein S5 domain 2-like protein [Gyrodon lividus]|nr:ribosomal protein S5 domain 2-like protein [Gyrodon lividus]